MHAPSLGQFDGLVGGDVVNMAAWLTGYCICNLYCVIVLCL